MIWIIVWDDHTMEAVYGTKEYAREYADRVCYETGRTYRRIA